MSEQRVLRIVGQDPDDGRQPALEGVLPARLPPLSPEGSEAITVRLFGTGFETGAVVYAHIDEQAPIALPTEWVSAHELRARLTRQEWGESRIAIVLGVRPRIAPVTADREASEHAAYAVVLRYIVEHETGRTDSPCVALGDNTSFRPPSDALLKRIRKDVPKARALRDDCATPVVVLFTGIRWKTSAVAEVTAGDLVGSTAGRPMYTVRRGFWGKWRVVHVSGLE